MPSIIHCLKDTCICLGQIETIGYIKDTNKLNPDLALGYSVSRPGLKLHGIFSKIKLQK